MDQYEEIMTERIALLERSVKAAEESQRFAGIDVVDDEGNFVRHLDFKRDPEPFRTLLREEETRLANYREGMELDRQREGLV